MVRLSEFSLLSVSSDINCIQKHLGRETYVLVKVVIENYVFTKTNFAKFAYSSTNEAYYSIFLNYSENNRHPQYGLLS